MFGIKLRSWMEAHIVRPRKKRSKEGKGGKNGKGGTVLLPDPPMKSSLAEPSSTSSAGHTASPAAPSAKRVTLVSPTPSSRVSHDRGEGDSRREEVRARLSLTACCAAGSSPRRSVPPQLQSARARPPSPRGPAGGPRYSTYLSSPESAYSTGYSTDATSPHGYSPGTSLPPEYYINLRTGTRYFQSAERQQQQLLQQHNGELILASTSSGRSDEDDTSRGRQQRVKFGHQRTLSTAAATTAASLPQQHHHPYCRHTVSKVSSTTIEEGGFSYGAPVPQRHRRTESADANSCGATPRAHPHVTIRTSFQQVEEVSVCTARRPSLVQQQQQQQQQTPQLGCNSPRQRSRIRTNPWMSSGTTGSSSTAEKLQWTTSSSCSDIAPTPRTEDISTAATIGSWRRDDGHTTTTTTADEESPAEEVTAFRRPSRRRRSSQDADRKNNDGVVLSPSIMRRGSVTSGSCSTISSSPPSTPRRSSPSSHGGNVEDIEDEDEEDDLTLNEIGRFDESYVYEKETDILSDSDPTDCEDEENEYNNGNLTDRHSSSDFLDMSYQNGINNSLKTEFVDEDDLDYIDNGPLDISCDIQSDTRINTGHCTYHHNNLNNSDIIRNGGNLNNNHINKNLVRPASINNHKRPSRRRAHGESGKRQSIRKESHQEHASPVRRSSQRKSDASRRSVSCGGRRSSHRHRDVRALAEAEVSSCQVTPTVSNSNTPLVLRRNAASSSNTPIVIRRNATSSSNTPVVMRKNSKKLSPVENKKIEEPDRRSIIPGSRYCSAFASEVRLIEADKEADKKYQQLILEAETLLVHMKSASMEEEDVDLETPTVENPPRPFPQKQRPDIKNLHLQVTEPNTPANNNDKFKEERPTCPQQSVVAIQVTTPSGGPPRALVTFRSIDLSSPVAAEAPYCPQSEPLKRKVYSSAALQRLQQHLALAECAESSDSSPPDDDEHSVQDRLGQKVAELRRERLAAEARLASREEERRKRRERARAQQQLALTRRNTILNTLESLKKDLQLQSASLHDAYSSITDLRSPSAADAQRCITSARGHPPTPSSEKPRCDFLSPIRRASSLRSPTAPKPPPRRC